MNVRDGQGFDFDLEELLFKSNRFNNNQHTISRKLVKVQYNIKYNTVSSLN